MLKILSPNFNKGRSGYKPECIVIHVMAGSLTGTDSWFANPTSQVSTHYGIGFNGEIHQYVEEEDVAWGNGRVSNPTYSLYKPNVNPNLYTISIEHEGQDLSKGTPEMIEASAKLVREIATRWNIPINRDHIIGHYQIFDKKPFCPATDKSIIDKIIEKARTVELPQSIKEQIKLKVKELEELTKQL